MSYSVYDCQVLIHAYLLYFHIICPIWCDMDHIIWFILYGLLFTTPNNMYRIDKPFKWLAYCWKLMMCEFRNLSMWVIFWTWAACSILMFYVLLFNSYNNWLLVLFLNVKGMFECFSIPVRRVLHYYEGSFGSFLP